VGSEEGEGGVAFAVGHGGILGGQWDGFLFFRFMGRYGNKKRWLVLLSVTKVVG
jgi:hypothetical protein